MFWLFENITSFSFIQFYKSFSKYKDSSSGSINLLYDFTQTIHDIPEIKFIKPLNITYVVHIKDNYIQFISDNNTITWKFEKEFIKETDELNTLKIPYFKWKYTLVENSKVPNTSQKYYDLNYPKISFKIYKINNNKLFISQNNNDNFQSFFLEKIN